MPLEFAAKSDVGSVRKNNEDAFFMDDTNGIFVVCDGMGGHSSGEVASRIACDIIGRNLPQALERRQEADRTQAMDGRDGPALGAAADLLVSSIRLANQAIYEASQQYAQNRGMGTTVAALLVRGDAYAVAWVGDSRVYLIRHRQLQQLTVDHSLVQEQVAKGIITSEQAEASEFKNILTRALGAAETVEVDCLETPAFDNDYIILCSDGLTRMVPDHLILETAQSLQDPTAISERLVRLALDAGGKDNVTAITVRYRTGTFWDKFKNAVAR